MHWTSAVEVIESVLSVCVSVCVSASVICVSVSALTAEPFNILTRNIIWTSTRTISNSMFKVIGQSSRSTGGKILFLGNSTYLLSDLNGMKQNPALQCDVRMS